MQSSFKSSRAEDEEQQEHLQFQFHFARYSFRTCLEKFDGKVSLRLAAFKFQVEGSERT